MSKAPFLFPLHTGDVAIFCHPSPASPLALPHMLDGDLTAGNGHIAIRARSGRWSPADFTPPPYEFNERLGNLPWHRVPGDSPEWRALDDIRGYIYKRAPIALWKDDHTPAPCPVWRIGGHHRIRLSHLQLLARLPRCEVFAGEAGKDDPLFIRYNGGTVIVPPNRRLETQSREIFPPTYNPIKGHRNPRYAPQPNFKNSVLNWPPPEPLDD